MSAATLESRNPADPEDIVWRGSVSPADADAAVERARRAWPAWAALSLADRAAALRRWQDVCMRRAQELGRLITREMGKTLAEGVAEAKLLVEKVNITLDDQVLARVRDYELTLAPARSGMCRFRPYGVMVVLGPFNFPAHLPNGHWVPALLLGNTVIFKPSEKTPAVGALIAEFARDAGFPDGVFNVVQGGADVARRLVSHDGVDGILFTGSWPVGRSILEANLDRPGRIVALEMGGSNPALILRDADLRGAVIECVRSAFATTGQRCTCTRRIIVHESISERFIAAFCKCASTLLIGPGDAGEPVFMGPVVSESAAQAVISFQSQLAGRGATLALATQRLERRGWFVTPAVAIVPRFERATDSECFGPLVQISVAGELDEMISQANASDFGLVASVFTADDRSWTKCFNEIRAGCINRNCGTAGASSKLPFGGLGRSGNLRPAAAFSVDSSAYPVASLIDRGPAAPPSPGMLVDDRWFAR